MRGSGAGDFARTNEAILGTAGGFGGWVASLAIKWLARVRNVVIATQAIGHLPRLAGSRSVAPFSAASEETATIDRDNNLPAAAQVAKHLPDRRLASVPARRE